MSAAWIVLAVVAALTLLPLVWGVGVYNRLVSARNAVKNAFQQIDVQLQRRYDLIPNLVETAKAYMAHERDTLEAVVQARNQAQAVSRDGRPEITDPAAMRDRAMAEAALGGALGRFFALAEAYPDLKANQNMAQLQEELTSTENRVAFARQAYNDSVMAYNNRRESFPDTIVANSFNFEAAQGWEVEQAEARQAVKVAF